MGLGEVDLDDPAIRLGAQAVQLAELSQERLGPGRCRRLVVEVALDPGCHPRGAQGRKAFVESAAGGAEIDVAGITQRQHREADAIQLRRVLSHECLVERGGALRRVALAPGAGEHQEVLVLGEIGGRDVGHVEQLGVEALLAGRLLGRGRQLLGIAGFGAVEQGERHFGLGRCRRAWRRTGRREIAGQKARQPLALLGAGGRHDRIQRPDLLGRKRRGIGQDRQSGCRQGGLPVSWPARPLRPSARAGASARSAARQRSLAVG